jgi:hypothetical protein
VPVTLVEEENTTSPGLLFSHLLMGDAEYDTRFYYFGCGRRR